MYGHKTIIMGFDIMIEHISDDRLKYWVVLDGKPLEPHISKIYHNTKGSYYLYRIKDRRIRQYMYEYEF